MAAHWRRPKTTWTTHCTASLLAVVWVIILLQLSGPPMGRVGCWPTLGNMINSSTLFQKLKDRSDRFSISSLWDFTNSPSVTQQNNNHHNGNKKVHKCGHQLDSRGYTRNKRSPLGPNVSGRIVGGREATINDFPWIVSLQREKSFWFGLRAFHHSCGGSLIAPSWILTAAHCLYQRDEPLRAVAGTDNMNFLYRAQIRDIEQQFYHPDFDISSYDNDIALIKVSEPFNLGSTFSPVGLVCLDSEAPILPYDIATICGFGARAYRQKVRSHLYETSIAIIDQRTCNASFGNAITDNMICAGGMIQDKRDACSGDSGGPLLLEDLDDYHIVQIGIVSFGNDCALKNYPGIYTRISNYMNWILENIDEPLGEP